MTVGNDFKQSLAGKTALITGGSRGIGAAIAHAFSAAGATVVIVHHGDAANADNTWAQCTHQAGHIAECDVTDEQAVIALVDSVKQHYGTIDILVNSAGIGAGADFETMTLALWNQVMAVNLTGSFLLARYCYPLMKARQWGRIINIASQMAFSGGAGAAAYCASKAGVIGFTRSLAVEAAPHGITVNCIAPGATQTAMLDACGEEGKHSILQKIPLGRFGRPEEIAPTALLLASEGGAFYIGQTLSPNGGDVLR